MKLLVINEFGHNVIVEAQAIPSIGFTVNLFHDPYPTVISVLMWPNVELREKFGLDKNLHIEAIIFVGGNK